MHLYRAQDTLLILFCLSFASLIVSLFGVKDQNWILIFLQWTSFCLNIAIIFFVHSTKSNLETVVSVMKLWRSGALSSSVSLKDSHGKTIEAIEVLNAFSSDVKLYVDEVHTTIAALRENHTYRFIDSSKFLGVFKDGSDNINNCLLSLQEKEMINAKKIESRKKKIWKFSKKFFFLHTLLKKFQNLSFLFPDLLMIKTK